MAGHRDYDRPAFFAFAYRVPFAYPVPAVKGTIFEKANDQSRKAVRQRSRESIAIPSGARSIHEVVLFAATRS